MYATDMAYIYYHFRFYCNGSTIDPNPSYAQCPIGNYCPLGSYQPTPCPSGTIATGVGNDNLTDCEPCKPGNYCTASASQNGMLYYLLFQNGSLSALWIHLDSSILF